MPLNVLCSTIPVTIATPLYHCDYYLEHGHVRNSWFNVAESAFGHLKLMLEGLQMEMLQFIDLCFLLGCDYLKPIKGIGPKLALKLVHEFSGLEAVLEHLCDSQEEKEETVAENEEVKKRNGGVHVPEEWLLVQAKKIFAEPDVTPADQIQLEWESPNVEGLIKFLVKEKGFNEEHVRKGTEKFAKSLNVKQQGWLHGFFTATPNPSAPKKATAKGKDVKGKGMKCKAEDKEEPKTGKRSKDKK